MIFFISLVLVLLGGCSSWTFERITPDLTTRVTRTGFITDVSADEVKIEWGSDSATVSIVGGKSEQTKALEAVAKGAAAGAKGGL